jgi:hypothetical protein
MREPATVAPRYREWNPVDVAGEAFAGLAVVFRGLTTIAIWVLIWLLLYGIPLLALWLLRGRMRTLGGRGGAAGV